MKWLAIVEQYLHSRRDFGYKLTSDGQILKAFAIYAEEQNATLPLDLNLVQKWAALAPSGSDIAIARRMAMVRVFSKYLHLINPTSPVVPIKLIGRTHRRLPPFIFNQSTISACMAAASDLLPAYGIRSLTLHTMLGLLVSSGLRPGEAVRLNKDDFDIANGTLTITQSKNWHRRIVPLDGTTVRMLCDYCAVRALFEPLKHADSLFLMDNGEGLSIKAADHAFKIIREKVHLDHKVNGRYPRLYDFRHTFVCRRIQAWYEAGQDVNAYIPQLSRYLGHKKIQDTYWYITATPELMRLAANRFGNYCDQGDDV
ncbi:tyrosine-type recombinase/integrase [Vibrio sp. 1180_3]|uniref:tyrosine-type recombinase/integrase n=1 Tax=Vibrio sp. 1180_3 TaxID=2528832 RepID=UPI002406BC91|nr:tyrosine-type recombinase/integrase [Vibrio sp. 1180_3]MDF9399761.1 hypothetical protein [Vibrio sp. 1180_3]